MRRVPRREYLALDDQPAKIITYTETLERHRKKNMEKVMLSLLSGPGCMVHIKRAKYSPKGGEI